MRSFVIPFKLLVVVVVSVVLLSYTICKAVTAEWLVPVKIRIRAGQIIPDLYYDDICNLLCVCLPTCATYYGVFGAHSFVASASPAAAYEVYITSSLLSQIDAEFRFDAGKQAERFPMCQEQVRRGGGKASATTGPAADACAGRWREQAAPPQQEQQSGNSGPVGLVKRITGIDLQPCRHLVRVAEPPPERRLASPSKFPLRHNPAQAGRAHRGQPARQARPNSDRSELG